MDKLSKHLKKRKNQRNKKEQLRKDVNSVGEYIVRSEIDKDGIRVTQVVDKAGLDMLYFQATDRLIEGMLPGAHDKLQAKHPKSLQATINKLKKNYTPKGIEDFEASMVRGMKGMSLWRG